MTKLKSTVVGTLVVAALSTGVFVERNSLAKVRTGNHSKLLGNPMGVNPGLLGRLCAQQSSPRMIFPRAPWLIPIPSSSGLK